MDFHSARRKGTAEHIANGEDVVISSHTDEEAFSVTMCEILLYPTHILKEEESNLHAPFRGPATIKRLFANDCKLTTASQ